MTAVDRCPVNTPTVTGRARRVGSCFQQTTIHLSPIQARSSQLSARLGYYAVTFPATGSTSATRRTGARYSAQRKEPGPGPYAVVTEDPIELRSELSGKAAPLPDPP